MLSRYLTVEVEPVLVAVAVGAELCETAVEVILNAIPLLQALAMDDGPTDVSPAVKTDLTYMYCVAVDDGPVVSCTGLNVRSPSGVTAVVGAVAVPHQNI
jgi:hypothetical protein